MNIKNSEAYKNYLNQQIVSAAHNFDEAKANAISELEKMTVFSATEYGAGFLTEIDNVTRWATEVQKLSQIYEVLKRLEILEA